jgi:hypothetical protein
MRCPAAFSTGTFFFERLLEDPEMRTSWSRVLMLAAFFAIFTATVGFSQTVQTATVPEVPTKAEFLATLAGDLSAAPGGEALPPSPTFLSTTCSSNADCPTGQLCCYPCGIPDCEFVCMTPWRNRCPPIP